MNLERFLTQCNDDLAALHRDRAEASWMAAVTGDQQWQDRAAETRVAMDLYLADREKFRQLSEFRNNDAPPLLRRQVEDLYRQMVRNQLPEDDLKTMARLSSDLNNRFNTYRATLDGSRVPDNEIRSILISSDDTAKRQRAWEASKQIGQVVEEDLLRLVRKRNTAARSLGYADYHAMSYELQELDRDNVFAMFGRLKRLSDEPYARLKTEIDGELAERFGIGAPDLRPWHYADPFFQEAPPSREFDFDALYRDADLERLTHETFALAGMDIAGILGRSDLYPREGKNQHAFCSHIDRRGDVRVLCNNTPSHHWMMVMLHEFGHAVYDEHLDPDLPFLLRRPAHTLTTEGVAMLFGRLNKTTPWLVRLGLLNEREAERLDPAVRRTLRRQMLVSARWILTMVHFERELYENPDQDLNRRWWQIAAENQLLNPPDDTGAPHWAAKIHFTLAPVYYQNYLLGELTASQLQNRTERESPDGLLTPAAGAFLKESFFRPGARRHWNEKLEKATGEPLNPDHFIEHFVRD